MNDLITTAKTMSSREIAELTGKRPADVMRDIRNMLSDLELDERKFASVYLSSNNQERTEYLLDHDHTDCLLTGYSAKARMAVIKRWKELENKDLVLPAWIAELSPQASMAIEDLNSQLEAAKPKLEYHDKVLAAPNGLTTTEIAATLGVSAIKLNRDLKTMGIQRKIGNRWVLTAPHLGKGYDVESIHIDDEGKSRPSLKWTELGRKFIHGLLNE